MEGWKWLTDPNGKGGLGFGCHEWTKSKPPLNVSIYTCSDRDFLSLRLFKRRASVLKVMSVCISIVLLPK